jgi:hypothetical protein
MTVGDHVKIVGDHPHKGKTGKIIEHWAINPLSNTWEFVVRLDGECLDCAANEANLKDIEL